MMPIQNYTYENSMLHKPYSISSLKYNDGQIVSDSLMKATRFNNYFSSVFTIDNNCTPITHHPPLLTILPYSASSLTQHPPLLACSLSTIQFPP